MLPAAPLAALLAVPLALLAGLYFLESKPWRVACGVGLILWLGAAVAWSVFQGEWVGLFLVVLILFFWFFMAEIKRIFGE